MLRILLIVTVAVLLFLAGSGARSSEAVRSGPDTCFYFVKCPPDIDMPQTPHFDTSVTRMGACKVQALLLPSWGTETSYRLIPADTAAKITSALSTHFSHGQKGIIDITQLPAGKYSVHLMACGNGGFFGLTIK